MSHIKPLNYNLTFEPNLKTFTFNGTETLTFQIEDDMSEITLDSVDLTIKTCKLIDSDTSLDFKLTKTSLIIQTQIKKGTHKIFIEFEGKLENNLVGFYRSRVESQEEEYIATTQFEAADARRAFPCIDHPSYKAVFDVSMIVPKKMTAISNTQTIKEEKLPDEKKQITFAPTPLMSTYLLYLGAGNFDIYEDTYHDITVRGITTHGKAVYTKFAVDCTKKSLEYFENYFGEPFPLKKLDVIAIPDFAAGAMENWGAITFRENLLLYYKDSSSIKTKQRIAEVVAHEVAHQWFGNLVTMKWWDDLWLNESFATFMAYKMIDTYWPEWNIWDEYVVATVFRGMALDSLHTSHPIHVEVKEIEQASELFDEIAYDKGGSILRMIEGYLGHDLFAKGLKLYIKEFMYQNTEAKDLWSCLEKASSKPIVDIMQTQITQTGFPSVSASFDDKTLTLTQSWFLLKNDTDSKEIWKLPITLRIDDKPHSLILNKESMSVPLQTQPETVVINENYNSFFISDYSPKLLELLGKNIQKLSDIEKQGIVHDIYNLVFAGKKPLNEFVETITLYFKDEKNPSILLYILEKLNKIYFHLKNENVAKSLEQFSKNALHQTGYEPKDQEHPYTTQLRSAALFALSLFNDEDVKQFSLKKFDDYQKNNSSLHPDLRDVVYALSVWYDKTNYKTIQDLYKKSDNQEEKARYLMALGNTQDKSQLDESLRYILSDEVRFNQIPYALVAMTTNPDVKTITLEWLFAHWPNLITKAGGTINHIFRRILKEILPNCGTGRVTDVKFFIQKNPNPELTKTFEQVIEELEINNRFIESNKHPSL